MIEHLKYRTKFYSYINGTEFFGGIFLLIILPFAITSYMLKTLLLKNGRTLPLYKRLVIYLMIVIISSIISYICLYLFSPFWDQLIPDGSSLPENCVKEGNLIVCRR